MEEPLVPYFRIVLIMIVFVCMTVTYQLLASEDGTIATNINLIVETFFANAQTYIPKVNQ